MRNRNKLPEVWFMPRAVDSPRERPPLTASPPEVINKRITVTTTDSPSTDRHISIKTYFRHHKPTYEVAVVDGFGHFPSDAPSPHEFATPDEARSYANRLLKKERDR